MAGSGRLLFSQLDLRRVLEAQVKTMHEEIEKHEALQLLNTSVNDLAAYFAEKYCIEPPALQNDRITTRVEEAQVDVSRDPSRYIRDRSGPFHVPGTRFVINVPFTGDADLFRCQPSQFTLSPPNGTVSGQVLTLSYTSPEPEEAALKQWRDRTLEGIRGYLATIAKDVEPFNARLADTARSRIEARRERLLKSQGLAASLGFKLEARPDAPPTYAVDIRRAKAPAPPPASAAPYAPEPALDEAQYEQILAILRPMAMTMERDPAAFRALGEEHLRSFFLAALNSHFQGRATGETFNATGKTDILIREEDRNIFIAECKIWDGPASLREAIDQVLGYAAWRDTKTAVLLFSRNKNFTAVLQQINPAVKDHPSFKRELERRSESESRYRFGHSDDPNRELTLTVMAFNIPVP